VGTYSGSAPVTLTNKTNAGAYTEKVTGLTGPAAGNYEIDTSGNTTGILTIAPKAITITPTTGQHMEYNGSIPVVANLTHGGASDLVTGDLFKGTMGLAGISKNAGNYAITRGTLGIDDGNGGANYAITFTPSVQYTITPKTLTLSGITVQNKTYDGNAGATVTGYKVSGFVDSETVGINSTNAAFNDKNAVDSKTVTVSGISLSDGLNGGLASNYSIADTATTTAKITKKAITVSGITAQSKAYDSNTTATLNTGNMSISNVISGDIVNITDANAQGTFDSAGIGIGKTVTVTGLRLTGADADNYQISPYTTTADINNNQSTEAAKNTVINNPVQPAATPAAVPETPAVQVDRGGINAGGNTPPAASSPSTSPATTSSNTPAATTTSTTASPSGTASKAASTPGAPASGADLAAASSPSTSPAATSSNTPAATTTSTTASPSGNTSKAASTPEAATSGADLAGKVSLVAIGNQTQSYPMTITSQSVTITLPSANSASSAAGTGNSTPSTNQVNANGVALVTVGGQGTASVVDTCNISSTGSSVTVTSAATPTAQTKADLPQEPAGNVRTETFKLARADGSIAEFSASFKDGALLVKPLNSEAVELSQDSGAGLKVLAATGLLTVQDKWGVQADSVGVIYVSRELN
ncbi:MAG: YDG domain-containing protein, partial [Pelosinus sp.]|nr:YDG domain-containing protein [Pelosinus sp.]